MSFRIEILPAAEADIFASAEWYEKQQQGLATRFTAEVSRAARSLSEQALFHRIRYKRKKVRWVFPKRFPHKILYYVDGWNVKIFAVMHASRRDRHWKDRV